jgi:hypothetical protein
MRLRAVWTLVVLAYTAKLRSVGSVGYKKS